VCGVCGCVVCVCGVCGVCVCVWFVCFYMCGETWNLVNLKLKYLTCSYN